MTDFQSCVLRAVATTRFGQCVGDLRSLVGRQPGAETNKQHSAAISKALRELEKLGLVRRMDNELPIVWMLQGETK